jgi:archaellum biogenesis ATPase FlaH
MENPFLYIVPRNGEQIVNMTEFLDRMKKTVTSTLRGGTVVVLLGEYGSGKSLLISELKKHLSSKKIAIKEMDIGPDIIERVYSLKEDKRDMVVVVDQVDLFVGMDKEYLKNFLNTIRVKAISGITFFMTMNKKTFEEFSKIDKLFKNMTRTMEIPNLSYEHMKKLVVSRLNEIREKKSDSIEPFEEEELQSIWEKSSGNPRLILLLCSTLYDKKMKFK